ncbi:het-6-heterokaryon incompatibility [Fusarium napiforme]|uniref:Het-6-heterokaryon incompatibility n=1 Tax=Fusarium napiforme TaxID=42672 RepID=A0A8H5K3N9_9HYPO|nr:het-6-heterokaryon incompatibility [Fusarium napiforme]
MDIHTFTVFPYQPLKSDELRLLLVEPGNAELIRVELKTVKCRTSQRFWALSYVWGARENPATILLNDQPFSITRNLYNALYQYRRHVFNDYPSKKVMLWVDAICINQNDQVEKSIQVPRMSEIYGQCERVLAWLGPVDSDEESHVCRLAERLKHFQAPADSASQGLSEDERIKAFMSSGRSDERAATEVESVRKALRSIGHRPWFRRIWILQEAVLAKKQPILLCGSHELGYEIFFKTWVLMLNPSEDGQLLYSFMAENPVRFKAIELVYKNMLQGRSEMTPEQEKGSVDQEKQCALDIVKLLNETTELEATVAHDRLYALIGLLACDPLPSALQPDYTQSFEELCYKFSMFILQQTQDIRVVNLGTVGNLSSVPSWTPDLRNSWTARSNLTPSPGKCFNVSEDGKLLTMPTIILGHCVSVCKPVPPDPDAGVVSPAAFLQFDEAIVKVAAAIRRVTRMQVMTEWLKFHLSDIYTEERLTQNPIIVQRVMMAYCQDLEKAATIMHNARPAIVPCSTNEHRNGYHILAGADDTLGSLDAQKAFHSACLEGQTEVVKSLLGRIANINGREIEFESETPLTAACRMGYLEIVNLLLENGADANIADDDGWTPLHWAISGYQERIIERLLQVDGLNINAIEKKENRTPLNLAAKKGCANAVSQLLKKWPDLYIQDSLNWTPLMSATIMKHLEIVRMILGHKAGWKEGYLEIPDERKDTPLQVASMMGSCGIACELINAGADCDCRFLGDDPDPRYPYGNRWTPLHFPCIYHQPEIFGVLLSSPRVEINAIVADGRTPLHAASLVENERIVRLLLQRKPYINPTDDNGCTPLHLASGYCPGRSKRTRELDLIKHDVYYFKDSDPMKQWLDDHPGQYVSVIELLFQHGADTTIKDENGFTALHKAVIFGDKENIDAILGLMQPDALVWEDWEESPVYTALLGDHPYIAMESLLSKREVKEAPFWQNGGKRHLIEMAARMFRPLDILDLMFRELPSEREVLVTRAENWGPIQWAAHERLPCVLSRLIEDYDSAGDVDRMVHEALQATAQSITPKELEHEPSCEVLVQVVWILITNSQRTLKNIEAVKHAWTIVRNNGPPASQMRRTLSNRAALYDVPWRQGPDPQDYKRSKLKVSQQTGDREPRQSKEERDWQCGKDPRAESSKELRNPTILSTLQDILKDPPFAQMSQTHRDEVDYKLPVPGPITKRIVQAAEATVDLLTTIMSHDRYPTRDYYKVRSFFRDSWVEVPDKEARSRMMRPRSVIRPMEETTDLELRAEEATESSASSAKDEVEDDSGGSETMWSKTKLADSEDQKIYDNWSLKSGHLPKKPHGFVPASAIYMPYLSYSTHCRNWDSRLVSDDWDLKQRHDHYKDLLDTYKGQDKQQHGSPTIDECYYQFAQEDTEAINDQSCRNESQVVSKYLRENEKGDDMGVDREPNQWTVVRVNQLWIWTISTDWVITATSSPLDGSPDILVEEILNSLSKQGEYGGSGAQPVSAAELVPAIIDHCIGSYERRPSDGEHLSIGQNFSHYINRIGRKETTLFDDFRAWSPSEHRQERKPKDKGKEFFPAETMIGRSADPSSSTTIETTQRAVQAHNHGHDISAAIKNAKDLYCDIKDVRDELNILKSVAQYQQIVQRGLASKEVDESHFSSTYVVKDLRELDSIAERIQLAVSFKSNSIDNSRY